MKSCLLLIIAFISHTKLLAQSDNWIDGQAVWNYEFIGPEGSGALRIETMGDSVIGNYVCQKLKCDRHTIHPIGPGQYSHDIETSYRFIRFEEDTVWLWSPWTFDFSVLYDFTATQGSMRYLGEGSDEEYCQSDSYLFVDSVYSGELNGVDMTFYETRDSMFNSIQHGGLVNSHFGKMSLNFGYTNHFFPLQAWCIMAPDERPVYKLRCFQDDSLTYNPGNVDCDYYTFLSVSDYSVAKLRVFPNPGEDYFWIDGITDMVSLKVFSVDGKLVYEETAFETNEIVQTSDWKSGLYTIVVESKKEVQELKFTKR